jgi:hypothetical protein
MSTKVKTCKISTLIAKLQELQSQEGDLPIVMSVDTEGNEFNSIDPTDELDYALDGGVLVLYPSSEHLNMSDIANYTNTSTFNLDSLANAYNEEDEYDEEETKPVDEYFDDYNNSSYDDYDDD